MELQSQAQAPGPALIRLLAHLGGVAPPAPPDALSARLGHWVDWPQAVALAGALDARPAAGPDDGSEARDGAGDECDRLRAALVGIIEADRAFAAVDASGARDAAFYRQRYAALQQVMEAEIELLRRRLRQRLARRGGADGRLAGVDAVMERALAARERALLASLPSVLATHFERLQSPATHTATPAAPHAIDLFRQDMKRLLSAELDVRLHPTRGLLSALRTPDPHAH